MAVSAVVENGKLVETDSQNSLKNNSVSSNSSGMDKDSFLQLLVAQMQYQDPLEPTSNTEFISQYAQFSQVEQMQNLAVTADLQRASSLVGKQVYAKTTNSSGETKLIQGKVDYVMYEGNKAYVAINEQLYPIDDVTMVADNDYLEASKKAYDFVTALNKLPAVNGIDLTDGEAIDKLEKAYNEMTDYQKAFIAKEKVDALEKYVEKLKEVRTKAGQALVKDFEEKLGKLPEIDEITLDNADTIDELEKIYKDMSDEQKYMVDSKNVDTLNEYVEKIKELRAAEE